MEDIKLKLVVDTKEALESLKRFNEEVEVVILDRKLLLRIIHDLNIMFWVLFVGFLGLLFEVAIK